MKDTAVMYFVLNQMLIEVNDRLKGTNLYKREFKKMADIKDDVCQKKYNDSLRKDE